VNPNAIPKSQPDSSGESSPRRRLRNYLIDSSLQLRFATYLLAVACALSLGLGYLLWNAYRESSRLVALGDPRVDEALAAILAREDRQRMVWLAAALAVVVLCLLVFAVVVTHRVAGPALALARICRAVGEGDLSRPRTLRRRDLLVHLADEINVMIEGLAGREAAESVTLAELARRLRRPLASPAEIECATALERLAAGKAERARP
jgi:methyl-accepting chemotaxis protein